MPPASDDQERTPPSPDTAFATLGDETRMEILQTLGEAEESLSFSELHTRVSVRDSGRFNYHLDKLVGHFVRRSDDGYDLARAGERVIEAVLSGVVTDRPTVEPTRIDQSCQYCGAPIAVEYREERISVLCTGCAGTYGRRDDESEYGHIGSLYLPPAGVENRDPAELYSAGRTWGGLATMATASGVCPRCSAPIEESIEICDEHEGDDVCGACGSRYAVGVAFRCTNCIYERSGLVGVRFLTNTDLLALLTGHGINPITPESHSRIGTAFAYDEEVLSVEPFEARLTFTVDGDSLTLTVDDDLAVIDVTRDRNDRTQDRSNGDGG